MTVSGGDPAGFDPGALYAGCRARITGLVAGLTEEQAGAPVPACPGWSVHDVLAHLGGAVDDILAGNTEGVATPPWTAAQVEARREVPTAEIVARWNELAPMVEAGVAMAPERLQHMFVADVSTHEHDLRDALGQPGDRDDGALLATLDWLLVGFGEAVAEAGLPAVRVVAGGREWVCGRGEPALTLAGEPFELTRARMGRRSVPQLRALGWSGDPEPYLALVPVFPPPPVDLVG
ncbi:MAG: maleylpyruvate isomerase family mycothiol-dependent enzyme [Acidimicrobiales bacterium]|nr:maleylpyruvate isomerase family mycothiol-dependent enzyme [Acidimicrobiales bacterium]